MHLIWTLGLTGLMDLFIGSFLEKDCLGALVVKNGFSTYRFEGLLVWLDLLELHVMMKFHARST